MKIEIDKRECFDALYKMSAHLGMKLQVPELMAATPEDEARIEPLWTASLAELLQQFGEYATLAVEDDKAVYELKMPVNWKCELLGNLMEHSILYVKNALFACWLDYVKPDSAALYRTLNRDSASAIVHLLSLRSKPVRR